MSFNDAQKMAIAHNQGPMMVLAGPGSGKTLVITERTKKLIEEYGISPPNILVITFTKATAMEMKGRFQRLMGVHAPVNFGTFHSVFFGILKYAYHFDAKNILPEEKKVIYLKQIIQDRKIEMEDEGDFISNIISEISFVKGEMLDLNHYYSKNCSEDNFKYIYNEYERKLRNGNDIDFDDMLVMCYELFVERKDILAAWQEKYQYILIDEFQDINRTQYEIIRMLAAPQNNLFIVGDDDQSIYRFRGAKPEIMLGFETDYSNAKRVVLNTNYRSASNLVEMSQRVIINNKARFPKEIVTVHPKGENVRIKEFLTPVEECGHMILEIKQMVAAGVIYSDIAILYRTNTIPRLLVEKLMEYNLPFKIKDSLPNLFEHWITKNIISYIKIALGNRERGEFLQIINRPKRYVSRECFTDSVVSLDGMKAFYKDKEWMAERLDHLAYDIHMLKGLSPYAAVVYIRSAIGYESFLKEYAEFRRMNLEDLLVILDDLSESAKNYTTFEAWFLHMEQYTVKLKEQAKQRNLDSDSISLSTMHSSKGLEYRIVYIMDANEGITPHQKAVLPVDIEEERRLFYVAMTRAKERLFIYSVKERYSKKQEVSRFVGECLIDVRYLVEGNLVKHVKYGEGIIRQSSGGKIIVYFKPIRKEVVLDVKYCVAQRIIEW